MMQLRRMVWLVASLGALVLGAACSGSEPGVESEEMGTARIRLITPQVADFEITRVAVSTDTGFSTDLTRDPNTGDFTGSLQLPAGIHTFTGEAFVDTTLVGQSTPVPAEIVTATVTQVMIQILDITGGEQPDFGPIIESLTHPETATAGVEVMFAASVVDPDGDPVTVAWTDDCADSTFTAPGATVTGWSKATPGACRVTLTATSNGLTASESFSITAFDPGASAGAAEIVGVFVSAPNLSLNISLETTSCSVDSLSANASCPGSIASPSLGKIFMNVDWQNGTPGTVAISDDCGGAFSTIFSDPFFFDLDWLPPTTGAICRITAQATSGEGVVSSLAAAVLVSAGTAPQPTGSPQVQMDLFDPADPTGPCTAFSAQGVTLCGDTSAGNVFEVSGSVFWDDTIPGTLVLTDNCGGAFLNINLDPQGGFFQAQWQAPANPGAVCQISATATSLEQVSSQATAEYGVI